MGPPPDVLGFGMTRAPRDFRKPERYQPPNYGPGSFPWVFPKCTRSYWLLLGSLRQLDQYIQTARAKSLQIHTDKLKPQFLQEGSNLASEIRV